MTEGQIDALQIVLNNPVVLSALREVFDEALDESLPDVENESDDVVGQKYRAYNSTQKTVSKSFDKLLSYYKGDKRDQVDVKHI